MSLPRLVSTKLTQTERKRVLSLFILTNFALKTYLCSAKNAVRNAETLPEKIFTVYEKNKSYFVRTGQNDVTYTDLCICLLLLGFFYS